MKIDKVENTVVVEESAPKSSNDSKSKHDNDYFILFEKTFPQSRVDILSGELMFFDEKQRQWVNAGSSEILQYLKALAIHAGMKQAHVKPNLFWYMREKREEQGQELLLDIPKWDGVDYISDFAERIHSSVFSHQQIAELLKEWFSRTFERLYDPRVDNTCVIFVGSQGIGKDILIKAMTSGFGRFRIPLQYQGQQKDMLHALHSGVVAHIEEFDNIADKLPDAFLKMLITTSSTVFREAFGRSQKQRDARWSLIASCNRDDFLRDCTGNRRFIVIPVDKIDGIKSEDGSQLYYPEGLTNFPKEVGLKVLAQAKSLAYDKYRSTSETQDVVKAHIGKLSPVDPEAELFKDFLDYVSRNVPRLQKIKGCYFLPNGDHQDQVIRLASYYRLNKGWPRIKSLLARKGINCEVRSSKERGVGVPFDLIPQAYSIVTVNDTLTLNGVIGNGSHE